MFVFNFIYFLIVIFARFLLEILFDLNLLVLGLNWLFIFPSSLVPKKNELFEKRGKSLDFCRVEGSG